MHRSLRRTLPALAAAGIAIAAPLLTITPAQAEASGPCSSVGIEYSTDGGQSWTQSHSNDGGQTWSQAGHLHDMATKFVVRLTGETSDGCEYPISLASYSTEGSSWATSGNQTFLGWDTTTLDNKNPKATLDVSSNTPKCYGQIDLYGTGVKHDGIAGPLPKYPNAVFPHALITAWNGGTACTSTPSSPPPVNPTKPAPAGPKTTPPASPSASASASASTVATAPTASPSTPASTTTKGLAFTGTNGSALAEVAAGAAGLLVLGAGSVVFARRRSAKS
ncbi:hypothetical protein P3T36_007148 [Kitasatospora sp. MAP12-15]|uniref:hypothetical protein n=1 Tax=unclassified Kitasatospora TaxID=2633591 RepID=UPI0024762439|nr:hypothetical protein [Kitasatospora sp. MAP12-44]MDH6108981.1 hypothetical protein [Kitasatospora sp. MAP12-44]